MRDEAWVRPHPSQMVFSESMSSCIPRVNGAIGVCAHGQAFGVECGQWSRGLWGGFGPGEAMSTEEEAGGIRFLMPGHHGMGQLLASAIPTQPHPPTGLPQPVPSDAHALRENCAGVCGWRMG